MRRVVRILFLLPVAAPLGCATGGMTQPVRSRESAAVSDSGLDPNRVHAPLSGITPKPARPTHADAVKPLSARAEHQIDKARNLIGQQRYTEAAIALERALRYDPNHPKIHHTLAKLHWEAGNVERARNHATRALEVQPDDATAHYILGRTQSMAGDHEAAMLEYRTALLCSDIDRHPELTAMCHYYLADTLKKEGYLEAALAQYAAFAAKTATLDSSVDTAALQGKQRLALLARTSILESLGRPGKAANTLAPLVRKSPEDVPLACRYMKLLIGAGRFNEALAAGGTLPLDNPKVVDLLFQAHKAAGHPERLVHDLRTRIASGDSNPHFVLNLAATLMRLDRPAQARDALQQYVELHPHAEAVYAALIDQLLAEKAWREALRVCAEGIEHNPDSAAGLEGKIVKLANNKEAVAAILDEPDSKPAPLGLYLRGVLAEAAHRLDDAERWLRQCHDRLPAFKVARLALARVYLHAYRYNEALKMAARSSEDKPEDADLELLLGQIHERLDDTRRAEQHFQAAIQLDRSSTRAMYALARLYHLSGQRLKAQRQLRVLLEKDPDHEKARELLAFTYLDEGKLDIAVEQLEELRKRATSPLVKVRVRSFLEQIHEQDTPAYRKALTSAMKRYGSDVDTWLAVAQSYDNEQEAQPQRQAFYEALKIDPDNEEAALGVIDASRELLDYEAAARQLELLLRRRPNRHAWRLGFNDRRSGRRRRWPGLIELYRIIQDYDAALRVARQALTAKDLDQETRLRYRLEIFETMREAHRDEEAMKQLREWIRQEPQNASYRILQGSEYLRRDEPLQAVPIFESLYGSDKSTRALSSLLDALVAAKQYDRASQYVLDWLNGDPENDTELGRLMSILSAEGRLDDALELARNRLLRTSDRQRFQTLMILVLSEAKSYDKALDLIESLTDVVVLLMRPARPGRELPHPPGEEDVARLPNEPFSTRNLQMRLLSLRNMKIQILLTAQRTQAALRKVSEWLDRAQDPRERFNYLSRLAVCFRAAGNEQRANETLARALSLNTGDRTLSNDVAYGWIDQGIRLKEAEPLIRHALARSPRQAAYLDTFGWLLYKKGAFAEAKKWLLRANHIRDGRDPVILDHLGDALWRLGEAKEAIAHWKAAVEATTKRSEIPMVSADEKRVRKMTPKKLREARANRSPAVASLAASPQENALEKDNGD